MLSNNKKKGFTIFEMLVVMAIIAIIAVLVLARFKEGQKAYALSGATQRLAADIRQAQGMAVTGAETPGKTINEDIDISGYGIYINSNTSYVLFLNKKNDFSKKYNSDSVILKTIALPQDVTVDNVGASIFFVPPNPKTYINGDTIEETKKFTLTRGSNTQEVIVDKYGKIDIGKIDIQ